MNGLVNLTYTHDDVGNLTEEKTGTTVQRSITWTGFSVPSRIAKGSATIDFVYDADHARVKETRMIGATVDSQTYFVNADNALFVEIETKGTITEWKLSLAISVGTPRATRACHPKKLASSITPLSRRQSCSRCVKVI